MAKLTPVEKKVKWCNPDWALNPPALRTQTWPKSSLPTEITHLVQDLIQKLRFLMSHCIQNSVTGKMIGKEQEASLEKHSHHSVGHLQKARVAAKYGADRALWAGVIS